MESKETETKSKETETKSKETETKSKETETKSKETETESQKFEPSYLPQEVLDSIEQLIDLVNDDEDERVFMKNTGEFPVSVFPKVFRDYTYEVSKSLASSPGYVGLSVIAVVSVALGNAFMIRRKDGWERRPHSWGCAAGSSGANKSSSLEVPMTPLHKLQEENFKKYQEESSEYEYKMTKYESEFEEWQQAVRENRTDLSTKPEEPTKPKFKQIIAGDATMETIPDLLEANPRGIIKFHDELVGFVNSMNQYRSGSDRTNYMQIRDGKRITVNRKNKEPQNIESPFVCILGSIQPERLAELVGEKKGDKGDGFAQRFLYVFPDEVNYEEDDDYEVDKEVIRQYEDTIFKMYHSHAGKEMDPFLMNFNTEAKLLFSQFRTQCKDEMRKPNFPQNLESVWNKIRGNELMTMCLIVHAMRYFGGEKVVLETVDEDTVMKAITLIEYFKTQARKVFTFLDSNEHEDRILKICEYMKRRARKTDKGYFIKVNHLTQGKPFGRETRAGLVKGTLREMEKQGYGYTEEIRYTNNKTTSFFTLKYNGRNSYSD
jgi:DNA gyrase/topoisomerase IV subunit A